MPHRIAVSTLNASTIDILNVIRENASLQYQNSVPTVETAVDIPKVGAVIYGTPAFSNEFINALVNRIALVRVQSATFNNPYAVLKKGYLEFGESVEDIFVSIAKVFTFSPEKAENRELKQYKPNVKSAFHTMNWKVMYPVSINDDDLKRAFLTIEGVTDLIAKIVESVYTAANYDEYLLFKYMLIKACTAGGLKPIAVDGSNIKNYAKKFRGTSNKLPFMSTDFNSAGVKNTTPRERQIIFMDAEFNAEFDVEVLSAAFNMSKADFIGRLFLVDDWSTFDNERWETIRSESDGVEEVTSSELSLMANVKALIIDEEWFQVYDNLTKFTETYISSGLRWNYFYHTWKTISNSPFANAVVFIDNSVNINNPATIQFKIDDISTSDYSTVFSLIPSAEVTLGDRNILFMQDGVNTELGIAIQPYGAVFIPATFDENSIIIKAKLGNDTYTGTLALNAAVGATITLTKD